MQPITRGPWPDDWRYDDVELVATCAGGKSADAIRKQEMFDFLAAVTNPHMITVEYDSRGFLKALYRLK